MEWKKINFTGPFPIGRPFLVCNKEGVIDFADTCFELEEQEYYLEIPIPPPKYNGIITNDDCVSALLKT